MFSKHVGYAVYKGRTRTSTGYDHRGPCLVYKDFVNFINVGGTSLPLDTLVCRQDKTILKIIEDELGGGAYRYVAAIRFFSVCNRAQSVKISIIARGNVFRIIYISNAVLQDGNFYA